MNYCDTGGMSFCATVVGSGPNGLAAAITLAQAGVQTILYEQAEDIGGAARTLPLTLPGFHHDIGAAVFPLGLASPFFRSLPLADHGLQWVHSPASLFHPFEDAEPAALFPSLDETSRTLGRDARAWHKTFQPLCDQFPLLLQEVLQPMLHLPHHPLLMMRFGPIAALPARKAASLLFHEERTRALFLGLAAHANLPLDMWGTSAIALVLAAAAHSGGWPIVRGGAQSLSNALASYFKSLGGEIVTQTPIHQLPQADIVMLDTSAVAAAKLLRLPSWHQDFQYGPGVFKVDWALSQPIPWNNPHCLTAATVHLGANTKEIFRAESLPSQGKLAERPFVLLSQPTLFDPTRAPAGKHTAWAYCHVPANSPHDALANIEAQVERFAPGFRDIILARHTFTAQQMQAWNPNLIGGDLSGGAMTLSQTLLRPGYRTPRKGVYLCSSSTSPGGGVHGMCGHNAALAALQSLK